MNCTVLFVGGRMKYVVSYDISSDRMRRKVSKIMEDYGKRVQYSVFECNLDNKRLKQLYKKLVNVTGDMQEGSIKFYPLCASCSEQIMTIGIEDKKGERLEDEKTIVI